MSVINLSDLDLSSKRVLIRQDLNVPIKDGVVTIGRLGLSSALPSASNSPDSNGPEQAIGAYLATP